MNNNLEVISTLMDRNRGILVDLSKIQAFVHTTLRRIERFSWNLLKNDLTLLLKKREQATPQQLE